MKNPKSERFTLLTIVATTAVAVLSLLAPLPQEGDWAWLNFHAYLGVALAIGTLYVGAGILFTKGLTGFTPRLKRSYKLLCLGFIFLGIAEAQLPIVAYSPLLENVWRDGGPIILPFAAAFVILFWGFRSFALLFGVKSIFNSVWFLLACWVVLSAVIVAVPHTPTSSPEAQLDGSSVFTVLSGLILLFLAIQSLKIKQIASYVYANALAWFFLSMITLSVAAVGFQVARLALGDEQWFLLGAVPLLPTLVAGVFLLRSAYSFNAITTDVDLAGDAVYRNFFGKAVAKNAESTNPSVDIIIYTASLVSNQTQIDSQLDVLRAITSKQATGEALSTSDETKLKDLYLKLEEYLVNEEKIRTFDRDSLRHKITQDLRITSDSRSFWPNLG
jgi:hypothetical protein